MKFLRPVAVLRSLLAGLLLALPAAGAQAGSVRVDVPPAGALGTSAQLLREDGRPLAVDEVLRLTGTDAFQPAIDAVPQFGIGAAPVWLHLTLENPAGQPVTRDLILGTPWTDRLDVYFVRTGIPVHIWRGGDGGPHLDYPVPGVGFVVRHDFPPGRTDLLIRAQTPDPLLVPLTLHAPESSAARARWAGYSYGLLYGFLLALAAYNLLLYFGLRDRSHLDYALYLGAFMVLNFAYTGHGYAWLWPASTQLQHYIILMLMLVFCCAGFRFSLRFLDLDRNAPAVARTIRAACYVAFGLMALLAMGNQQSTAALLAFVFVIFYVTGVVILGIRAVRRGDKGATWFLAAVTWGMLGAMTSDLTVWGFLPYNDWTYRALDMGMLTEATLLALAVADRVRLLQRARLAAEQLTRIDPLTRVDNRRAFADRAERLLSTARRSRRPLSLVLLDLDHFKSINDTYGHAVGDRAIQTVARLLTDTLRQGDLVGRWSGDEFIVLLPETDAAQAAQLAARLRAGIDGLPFQVDARNVKLTASLGLAELQDRHASLDALVRIADARLYRAKSSGRNRVCGPDDT